MDIAGDRAISSSTIYPFSMTFYSFSLPIYSLSLWYVPPDSHSKVLKEKK